MCSSSSNPMNFHSIQLYIQLAFRYWWCFKVLVKFYCYFGKQHRLFKRNWSWFWHLWVPFYNFLPTVYVNIITHRVLFYRSFLGPWHLLNFTQNKIYIVMSLDLLWLVHSSWILLKSKVFSSLVIYVYIVDFIWFDWYTILKKIWQKGSHLLFVICANDKQCPNS